MSQELFSEVCRLVNERCNVDHDVSAGIATDVYNFVTANFKCNVCDKPGCSPYCGCSSPLSKESEPLSEVECSDDACEFHDVKSASLKDNVNMFSNHIMMALKHVKQDDHESQVFIHNSIINASEILIAAPLKRFYESEMTVD